MRIHPGTFAFLSAILLGCSGADVSKKSDGALTTFAGRLLLKDNSLSEVVSMDKVIKTDAEWKKILDPQVYHITRGKGTELACSGALLKNKVAGIYSCAGCGLPLFTSKAKFESGTGWPSFYAPVASENVLEKRDLALGMERIESLCARCDAHLGHVFPDGPKPTGQRYCMNSGALFFTAYSDSLAKVESSSKFEAAAFGAGCFWGVEEAFKRMHGIIGTSVGYMGGRTINPTYEQVCAHTTGHAEAVYLVYDATQTTYQKVLDRFFDIHDPTQVNRQGPDKGDQYRSVIFTYSNQKKIDAQKHVASLAKSGKYQDAIATQIEAAPVYWLAEEYHQRYLVKNPGGYCHINLNKLKD